MDERRVPNGLEAWQLRRGIHPIDIIALCAVLVLVAGATVAVCFAPPAWSGWKLIAVIAGNFMAISGIIIHFFRKWTKRPDFVTKHGTAVWTDGIEEVTPDLMERALDRFLAVMAEEQSEAAPSELEAMLRRTSVEWKRGLVSFMASGYELRDKAGIQSGYKIMVQWAGNIADSALNHELLHEVNATVRLPRIKSKARRDDFHLQNLRHEEASWWMLEGMLADDF